MQQYLNIVNMYVIGGKQQHWRRFWPYRGTTILLLYYHFLSYCISLWILHKYLWLELFQHWIVLSRLIQISTWIRAIKVYWVIQWIKQNTRWTPEVRSIVNSIGWKKFRPQNLKFSHSPWCPVRKKKYMERYWVIITMKFDPNSE